MKPPTLPSVLPSLSALCLAFAAFVSLGCAAEEGIPEIWRFAIEEPVGSVQWAYAERFEELIEERTSSAVDVQVYPYGTLGTSDHVTELLRMGTVELATASPGHLGKLIPEVQVLLLHFVFSEDAEVTRDALRDPRLKEVFDRFYEEKGFRLLSIFQEGWQVWTTRKEVRSPKDFSGLRMRVMTSPMLLAAYQAYGASPTPLPYGEVYSALQLRMIDGQVNPVFAIEEMSFYEVTNVMTFPNHLPFVTTVAANKKFIDSQPKERQELIRGVIHELQDHIFDVQTRYNRERLDAIRQRKPEMEITHLTAQERQRFREASLEVRQVFLDSVGPTGREVLEALGAAMDR